MILQCEKFVDKCYFCILNIYKILYILWQSVTGICNASYSDMIQIELQTIYLYHTLLLDFDGAVYYFSPLN